MDNRLYWAELRNIRRLEPAEEGLLWQRYKEAEDMDARRILVESYQPLVFKTAAKYRVTDSVFMDLVQEGTVGLMEAAENYDPRRGVAFSLYALHRIRGRMLNLISSEGRLQKQLCGEIAGSGAEHAELLEFLVDPAPAVNQQVEQTVAVATITQAMERLPKKEQAVLTGVFFADQEPGQLAHQLDVSVAHVYRLQKQGLRRLRGMLSRWMQHW